MITHILKTAISLIILLLIADGFSNKVEAQRYFPSFGNSRSGTSGFQFLKIEVDARAAAMGNSVVADARDGSALYWNPAMAAQIGGNQVFLGHTQYFEDITLNYVSYVHKLNSISLGASVQFLSSGDIEETDEFNQFGTGRIFRTSHMAVGLSFAQQLSTIFSYGISLKYLDERIENITAQTAALDFGLFYRVEDTGLRFAVGLNNFGFGATPTGETTRTTLDGEINETEFSSLDPPTTFIIGAAFDIIENGEYNWLVTGQLTNSSDNAEKFSFGTELVWMNRFSARTGYILGQDEVILPSFGAGIQLPMISHRIHIDYGFTPRERLSNYHRFTLKFDL